MEKKWLVVVNNKMLKVSDMYRVFNEKEDALKWAKENGYEAYIFGSFGLNENVGIMNRVMYGDVDIGIMAIEVQ